MRTYQPTRATRAAIASRAAPKGAERGAVRPRPVLANHLLAAAHPAQDPVHQFASLALDRSSDTAPPPNRIGLPDRLKAGIEHLSGFAMDDVRVHYNSTKPATMQALAYAQGADIHVGPGQEKHLPHEAWHVVQQAQGRVKPTLQMKGVAINDDATLEREADVRGRVASTFTAAPWPVQRRTGRRGDVVQRAWIENDGGYKWDREIDGVTWFADAEGQMSYQITNASNIKKGNKQHYEAYLGQKKSWDAWNALSIEPDPKWLDLKLEEKVKGQTATATDLKEQPKNLKKGTAADPRLSAIMAALGTPLTSPTIKEVYAVIGDGDQLRYARWIMNMFTKLATASSAIEAAYEKAASVSPIELWSFLRSLEKELHNYFGYHVIQNDQLEGLYRGNFNAKQYFSLGLNAVLDVWSGLQQPGRVQYVNGSLNTEQFAYYRCYNAAAKAPPKSVGESLNRSLFEESNSFKGGSIATAIASLYDAKAPTPSDEKSRTEEAQVRATWKQGLTDQLLEQLLLIHQPGSKILGTGFTDDSAQQFKTFIHQHSKEIAVQLANVGMPQKEIEELLTTGIDNFIKEYTY